MGKIRIEKESAGVGMIGPWIKQGLLFAGCIFFLLFGIDVMVGAYGLKNPHEFVMTFFSASFIILLSATFLIGVIYRITRLYKDCMGKNSQRNT